MHFRKWMPFWRNGVNIIHMLKTHLSTRHLSVVIAIVLFLGIGASGLNDMIIYTPDSARYLARGISVASFEGFLDRTVPEPSHYVFHAPLYSVLLAPSQMLFPASVEAAKGFTFLLSLLLLFLFYLWLLPRAGRLAAMVATLFLALNPLTFIYSTQILSDIPFAACFILFFILAEKLEQDEHRKMSIEWGLVGTAVAVVFLREVGFTLIISATAFFILRKKPKLAATIFFVCLFLYFLWFVRNELVVGALENPPARNTGFFWAHLFTDQRATLVEEIFARIKTNAVVYAGLLGRLVLFPEFVQRAHSLISPDDPLVYAVVVALRFGRAPLILAMAGLSVYGLVVERTNKAFPMFVTVLVCYLGMYLAYPTNDIRYMYPFVPVILRLLAIGGTDLFRRYQKLQSKLWRSATVVFLCLCLVPNAVWMFNAVRNSWMYTISPLAFFEDMEKGKRYPEQFGKPLSLAAAWAARHCDSTKMVASSMKETAFWLGRRPVVEVNENTMDVKLRDYNVRYIVSLVSRIGVNELEAAMGKSSSFNFRPVHREGTVEVIEVTKKNHPHHTLSSETVISHSARKDSVRLEFRRGLEMLKTGKAQEAESLFYRLGSQYGREADIVFNIGIAKEFAGRLDEAEQEYRSFRLLPQAGNQIVRASYHLEVISRIRDAESQANRLEKAARLQIVAINYWELGFRQRALTMLRRSLEADSMFFPSLILHSLYSLEMADTLTSKKFLQRSGSIEPLNGLVQNLYRIFQLTDSLRTARSSAEKNSHRVSVARAYEAMGLREEAIGELLVVLEEDPSNESALRLLAELYEFKQRYAPALKAVTKLLTLHPDDEALIQKRDALLSRW
ncbi:MAG: glycosyltransferase family 39 protein [Ignavibacteriales bacterium]|nr:glycosyltransferase family 39 protein [Ignavibacteriales bacterium]